MKKGKEVTAAEANGDKEPFRWVSDLLPKVIGYKKTNVHLANLKTNHSTLE